MNFKKKKNRTGLKFYPPLFCSCITPLQLRIMRIYCYTPFACKYTVKLKETNYNCFEAMCRDCRNIYMLLAGWEVRIGKNCDRGLEKCCPGPQAEGSIFKPEVTVFPYTDRP